MPSVPERILHILKSLPEPMQARVLALVERLKRVADEGPGTREDAAWSEFSLSQALRGMEEEEPLYSEADLKEVFS